MRTTSSRQCVPNEWRICWSRSRSLKLAKCSVLIVYLCDSDVIGEIVIDSKFVACNFAQLQILGSPSEAAPRVNLVLFDQSYVTRFLVVFAVKRVFVRLVFVTCCNGAVTVRK